MKKPRMSGTMQQYLAVLGAYCVHVGLFCKLAHLYDADACVDWR